MYDGHGGRDIVDFLELALENNIVEEIKYFQSSKTRLNSDEKFEVDSVITEEDKNLVTSSLRSAFLLTDIQSRTLGIMNSGATVTSLLFQRFQEENRIIIYSANCGDGRAVLGRKRPLAARQNEDDSEKCDSHEYEAVRLSHDHKADDPKEIERIEKAGGFVLKGRVLGVLAVSRSLGDHILKEFIIAEPYISIAEVSKENDAEFVIIACDGLWDAVTDAEAVDLVRKWKAEIFVDEKGKKSAAQMLTSVAIERGSTDNVTVVVAWLHE